MKIKEDRKFFLKELLSFILAISIVFLPIIHSFAENYDYSGDANSNSKYNSEILYASFELDKTYTYKFAKKSGVSEPMTGRELLNMYYRQGGISKNDYNEMLKGNKVVLAITAPSNGKKLDVNAPGGFGVGWNINSTINFNPNNPAFRYLKKQDPKAFNALLNNKKYQDKNLKKHSFGGNDVEPIEEITTDKDKDKIPPTERHTKCEPFWGPWITTFQDTHSARGVIEYYMSITPVVPGDFHTMSKEQRDYWKATHQPQKGTKVVTEFGKTLRKHNREGTLTKMKGASSAEGAATYNYVVKELKDSLAKDGNIKEKEIISLNEKNKEGFANGGAFTVTFYTRSATIINGVATEKRTFYDCHEWYVSPVYEKVYKWNKSTESYEYDWKIIKEGYWDYVYVEGKTEERTATDGRTFTNIIEDSSFVPDTSYQIINVRCNKEDLEAFMRSIGGTITNKGYYSTAAKTPEVRNQVATFISSSIATKDFIYGTNCPIDCSSNPKDALPNSNAKENKVDENAEVRENAIFSKYFGAQFKDGSKLVNTSDWTFFRDGVKKTLRRDIWSIVGKYKNEEFELPTQGKASQTSFAINSDATPKLTDNLLDITLKDGSPLFKNSSTRRTLSGEVNTFDVFAIWASEKDHPVKLQSRYDYEPTINVKIPTVLGAKGSILKTEGIPTKIIASCKQKFNTNLSNLAEITNNPKNILPEGLYFGSSPEELFTEYITFVKGSAE